MADGHKNLRPPTSETARERGKKGGIASGIARRRRANLKKTMQMLLTSKGSVTIDGEDVTYEEALCLAMVSEALGNGRNNVAAFNAIRQVMSSEEDAAERKARIQKLKAETAEIERRAQAEEEEAEARVVIVDDIPYEAVREAQEHAGTDQAD